MAVFGPKLQKTERGELKSDTVSVSKEITPFGVALKTLERLSVWEKSGKTHCAPPRDMDVTVLSRRL